MPRPRFTLRWLMVAVAVAGIALAVASRIEFSDPEWSAYTFRIKHLPRLLNLALGVVAAVSIPAIFACSLRRRLRNWELLPVWMLALAIFLGWVVWTTRRGERFLAKAMHHYSWSDHLVLVSLVDEKALDAHLAQVYRQSPARLSRQAAMAAKYQRAARYPWLPVEPDPPEPE